MRKHILRRHLPELAIAAVVALLQMPEQTQSATFTTTGAMTTPRYNLRPVLLPNGKVLVDGSADNSGLAYSTAELYDPSSGTWALTGAMATRRFVDTATLLTNGLVLIAGGWTGSGRLASAELYNPATGTWSLTASMGTPRVGHTATLLPNGKVLVAGGDGGGPTPPYTLDTAELYDPVTATWTTTGQMPNRHYMHTATLLQNGKVLVAGGESGTNALSTAELYDPNRGSWTPVGPMTIARDYHTASLLPDGQVLVAGGHTGSVATYPFGCVSSAELYNPETGTWTATSPMRTGRTQHTATLLPNGTVLVASGQTGSNYTPIITAELYIPTSRTWTPTSNLHVARFVHSAVLLPSGKVLLTGGWNALHGSLSSAELYTPDPPCSPHKATATATLYNWFLVDATITDGGCGYTNPPAVLIQGGGGSGAAATAVVSNGMVVKIKITDAGAGYTTVPKIVIGSPPFVPTLGIAVSKVKVTQNVVLGRTYLLESSHDLVTWTATGPHFTAQEETLVNEFDVDLTGRYFRIRQVAP